VSGFFCPPAVAQRVRRWLFYGEGAPAKRRVAVWRGTREVALDGEAEGELEARRGSPDARLPLLELLRELAERGEEVVVLGWRLGGLPASWLLAAAEERGALSELDFSEWLRGRGLRP
jgi:hypothetical protein